MGFQREGECDGQILRTAAIFAQAKGQSRRPTAQVAVNGVILFFHAAIARFVMVRRAKTPVLVEPIKQGAGDEIIAFAQSGGSWSKIIAQKKMPKSPAP